MQDKWTHQMNRKHYGETIMMNINKLGEKKHNFTETCNFTEAKITPGDKSLFGELFWSWIDQRQQHLGYYDRPPPAFCKGKSWTRELPWHDHLTVHRWKSFLWERECCEPIPSLAFARSHSTMPYRNTKPILTVVSTTRGLSHDNPANYPN